LDDPETWKPSPEFHRNQEIRDIFNYTVRVRVMFQMVKYFGIIDKLYKFGLDIN
jgi:hypothetical protein